MNRSVRKFGLPAVCTGAFLLALSAAPRRAQAGAPGAGDCNSNGIPDANEASWNDRDDDGDGVCNGVDVCPYEYNPGQSAAVCAMQAITVPYIPSNPSYPHQTYPGATITLKGIARYGGNQYRWDFGDGGGTGWTAIGDAYNLGATHAYNAAVGRLFSATLYVGSGPLGSPTSTVTGNYFVQVQDSNASCGSSQCDPSKMDVNIAMAIDEGLWFVHVNQARSQATSYEGSPWYNQRYGYWDGGARGATCAALDALQLHGSTQLGDRTTDPYVEDVQRAVNYVLANGTYTGIGTSKYLQTGNYYVNPDQNGNGAGIFLGDGTGSTNHTYTSGICGVAIGSGGTPNLKAMTGPGGIYNRTYKDIMQDVTDWFSYVQTAGAFWGTGGWWYDPGYYGADGSTNQWPILAMVAARGLGATVQPFVTQQTPYFINNSRYPGANYLHGGWGYTGYDWLNISKTAAGILEHYFVGDSPDQSLEVQAGYGFMYRNWGDNGGTREGCWNANLGHTYAMYGVMKSMRTPQPNIARVHDYNYNAGVQSAASFDWYYTPPGQSQTGLATNIVSRQQSNGAVTDNDGCGELSAIHSTSWDTIILAPGVTNIPPKAGICDCSATWDINSPISFSGACSSDPDGTKSIAKYEWDFDYNGTTFNPTLVAGFDSSKPFTLKAKGYDFYTQDRNGNPLVGVTAPKVALRVTDTTATSLGGPLTNVTTCNVNIKPPPHCPIINAGSGPGGGPYLASVNQPVTFDASTSKDVDGDPITFQWDFHNNNLFADATGATATTSFAAPGTFVIGVAGTDHPELNPTPYQAADCTVAAYTTVQVGAHQPIASAGGPYTSVPGNTIVLDGSGSVDFDNLPLTYGWDLTGQNLYTDSTVQKPSYVVPASAVPGTASTICLKVSNGDKTSKPSCATVTIIQKQTPPSCKVVSNQVVASCNGGNVPIQIDGSRSTDANGNPLTYSWTSTCGVPFDHPTASIANLSIPSAQQGCSAGCTATLAVNNGYFTSTCDVAISILDNLPPTYATAPANVTIECDANATANVNAWLAAPTATDACAPAGSTVAMSNDFKAGTGCGGVGVGNTVKVTWSAQDVCSTTAIGQKSATVTVVDRTKPTLSLPGDITKEATANKTPVDFVATASDFVSGALTPTCTPASGSTFAVGPTTVNCTVTDGAGNTQTGFFTVTITDKTAPVLSLPNPAPVEATSAAGAAVVYSASALDLVDGSTAVSCLPVSGSTFAIAPTTSGVTTVNCTSTDKSGNTAPGSFTITVQDTRPPVVSVPQDIVAEAVGPGGKAISFVASASDIVDGALTPTCTPASGATFPVGPTTVSCTSTDAHGNTGSNSFTVTITDKTAPVFAGPPTGGSITREATSASGMTLTDYTLTASDIVDGATTVLCSPALPNTFAIGSTPVSCTSTDKAGNTASLAFNVVVIDSTPPALTCPTDLTVAANGPLGAENFGVDEPSSNALKAFFAQAKTSDLVDPLPSLTNDASWLFPSGQSTTVTFTSVDAHQNTSSCTATVTVTPENVAAPALTCPSNISLASGGAEIDWNTAFRRPVSVELIVTSGSPAAGALALSELLHHAVQLTATASAAGSYAVRIRATDEDSGLAVECNRFISTAAPAAALAAPAGGTLAAAVAQ